MIQDNSYTCHGARDLTIPDTSVDARAIANSYTYTNQAYARKPKPFPYSYYLSATLPLAIAIHYFNTRHKQIRYEH